MGTWLPWAVKVDLSGSMGNGPFGPGRFLGVVQHVNAGRTLPAFYMSGGGPASVCPNFQVDYDGTTWQFLPLEDSPWCQSDGNANYAAIEAAGFPYNEMLAPAQTASIVKIVAAYHDVMGMPLQLANTPGERGYGWHGMGGAAWGGHTGCPGDIRRAQMPAILAAAAGTTPPAPTVEDDMKKYLIIGSDRSVAPGAVYVAGTGTRQHVSGADYPLTLNNTADVLVKEGGGLNPTNGQPQFDGTRVVNVWQVDNLGAFGPVITGSDT